MRTTRNALLAAVLAVVLLPLAARAEPVRMVLLSPAARSVAPGELLDGPIRVRVERANGEPVPGVLVHVGVNLCVELATPLPGSECPGSSEYGGFADGANLSTMATSGPDGILVAPAFRAGRPTQQRLPFTFEILPYASTQTTPAGFTITLEDATGPIGGYLAAATKVQIGGSAAPIPALDDVHLVALGLVLAAAAAWKLRSTAGPV